MNTPDELREIGKDLIGSASRLNQDRGIAVCAAADAWEADLARARADIGTIDHLHEVEMSALSKQAEINNGRLAQERDDAVMAHHLAETRLEAALKAYGMIRWHIPCIDWNVIESVEAEYRAALAGEKVCSLHGVDNCIMEPPPPESWTAYCARMWRHRLPERYRPSLRQEDGLYEIFLYPDDPAYQAAEQYLTKRTFSALSAGYSFIGRPEDYARFETALAAPTCPKCTGTGSMGTDPIDWRCPLCKGSGRSPRTQELS